MTLANNSALSIISQESSSRELFKNESGEHIVNVVTKGHPFVILLQSNIVNLHQQSIVAKLVYEDGRPVETPKNAPVEYKGNFEFLY